MHFAFALCLAAALLVPIICNGADRKESGGPWIATAAIIRDGEQAGSGVYLNSGLIITAAHLTAIDAKMGVRIAGVVLPVLPAKLLKQGSPEDVDLSLLLVDEGKLLTRIRLPRMQLCEAPPWPGDPVIVVDARHATESQIVSPRVLPFTLQTKYSTLIVMLRRPEIQDPVFSTQIENACSASSAERWPLTRQKATKTLLNTSFRQWQFATLCRSNSDPDVIACSRGGLFVAGSGDAFAAMKCPPPLW